MGWINMAETNIAPEEICKNDYAEPKDIGNADITFVEALINGLANLSMIDKAMAAAYIGFYGGLENRKKRLEEREKQLEIDRESVNSKSIMTITNEQIKLLDKVYSGAINQVKWSYLAAVGASVIGFALILIVAPYYILTQNNRDIALISGISGLLSTYISVTLFKLYEKTSNQLIDFHGDLYKLQSFLIANGLSDNVDSKLRNIIITSLTNKLTQTKEDFEKPN
jgi:hypothetical protein